MKMMNFGAKASPSGVSWPKACCAFPATISRAFHVIFGYYNLENLDDLRKQVGDEARAGGVNGFAYYYYWFNRKRVLERPLELLLDSDVDMPFMLIWANENWTRTWDGSESQILLRQDYNADDEDALIDDLARHFRDRRYIRVDNRPLFVIYNPKNVPRQRPNYQALARSAHRARRRRTADFYGPDLRRAGPCARTASMVR